MGREVILIAALLCILQFGRHQAEGSSSSNSNTIFKIRIPTQSISNPPPYQSNNVPYPYFPKFSNNGCNSCQSSICQKRCTDTNKQLNLNFNKNQNPIGISFPSGQSRVDMVLNYQPKCQQSVNVVVTLKPKGSNSTNGTVTTSASSNATKTNNGNQIVAENTAQEGDQDVDVSVIVTDESSGGGPKSTKVGSEIKADDGKGDQSDSKTQTEVDETPKNIKPSKPQQNTPPDSPSSPPDNGPSSPTGPTPVSSPANPQPDNSEPAAPANSAPADSTPAGNAPPGNAPSGDAPSGNAPSGNAPSGDAPSGDAPAGGAPSSDAPSGDAPTGDTPAGSGSDGTNPSPADDSFVNATPQGGDESPTGEGGDAAAASSSGAAADKDGAAASSSGSAAAGGPK